MGKRSKEEMKYEKEQMKRQNNKCPICKREIFRGQTTVWAKGIIYHSGCGFELR